MNNVWKHSLMPIVVATVSSLANILASKWTMKTKYFLWSICRTLKNIYFFSKKTNGTTCE